MIPAQSPVSGKLRLTLKNGASADAVIEAQRVLGMVDEIEVESDIEFNWLLSVISQRLVRKLCSHCKSITHLEIEQINGFDISPGDDIYQANGCPECLQSGFRGRTGLYEMI